MAQNAIFSLLTYKVIINLKQIYIKVFLGTQYYEEDKFLPLADAQYKYYLI